MRDLQNEAIKEIRLHGLCLDIGGGKVSHYRDFLNIDGHMKSVNIDPLMQPDIISNLNEPLPIESCTYDCVVSFNTLEHIENDVLCIKEMLRVLKPGGHFHFIVPFIYRVHGSPCDYHRPTAHEWKRRLVEAGIPTDEFDVVALVWDAVATGYSFVEMVAPRLRFLLRPFALLPGLIHFKLRRPKHGWENFALAYHVYGRKPPSTHT